MKKDIFEKIDNLIYKEIDNGKHYENFEDLIVEYIAYFCFYSSKDFINNIIDQLENILEKVYK